MVELFHRIAEPDSARARQVVLDQALGTLVQFRNVAFPKAAAALQRKRLGPDGREKG